MNICEQSQKMSLTLSICRHNCHICPKWLAWSNTWQSEQNVWQLFTYLHCKKDYETEVANCFKPIANISTVHINSLLYIFLGVTIVTKACVGPIKFSQ